MSRLVDFYTTQVRILWNWRGGPWALVKRLVITLLVSTVALLLTAGDPAGRHRRAGPSMPSSRSSSWPLFNAIVRPVLLTLVAPRSLVLLGILGHRPAGPDLPGHRAAGRASRSTASSLPSRLVRLRRDQHGPDLHPRRRSRRVVLRPAGLEPAWPSAAGAKSDKPGLVIIQIDGLAHPILAGRVRAGSVNTMASWVRDGSHKLSRWEAILPSMTSASQAGILHGNNDGIPAFRWYERDRQKLMVSSNPDDAAEIVRRLSNGEGLLSNDGVSICNLMTGDATRAYVTTGAIKDQSQGLGDSQAFLGFFFSPSGYLRSFTMFLGEFFKERFQARRTRRSGIQPQMHRGMKYAGHARGEQRPPARHEHVADHRGDVSRRERHLLRLHRLRRARPPLRAGAGRVIPGARRRRRRDRHAGQGGRGRATTVQVRRSCPTTARASARPSSSATARASARSSAT